jgi:cytochrome c oxidase subunit 2
VYALVRFRKSRNPKANYGGVKGKASTYLEAGVAVFEGVLLIAFAIPFWSWYVNDLPDESEATVVRVIGEQFAWNSHYPGPDGVFGRTDLKLITAENPLGLDREDASAKDDITTINQLNVPVGKPVLIYLTTKDVIHSFGIPLLRVKHDAIPGERYRLTFTPTMTNAQIKESMTALYPLNDSRLVGPSIHVAMRDYNGSDGTSFIRKGDMITEDILLQMKQAGLSEVAAAPDTPVEIACAQLCGLGHYRMRGFVTLMTPEEYQSWLDLEASYLVQ